MSKLCLWGAEKYSTVRVLRSQTATVRPKAAGVYETVFMMAEYVKQSQY